MAAISLAETGTEFGECAEPCNHTDCAEIRRMKTLPCTLCEEPIGTRRFYQHDSTGRWDKLDHEVCVLAAIAEARAQRER